MSDTITFYIKNINNILIKTLLISRNIKTKNECLDCESKGFITEKQLVEINIPKGVEEGKKYIFDALNILKDWIVET